MRDDEMGVKDAGLRIQRSQKVGVAVDRGNEPRRAVDRDAEKMALFYRDVYLCFVNVDCHA